MASDTDGVREDVITVRIVAGVIMSPLGAAHLRNGVAGLAS